MHLEPWQWALGALGAFLVGLSKTGIPGLGILNVAIFALAFPARESVGIVLIILICADLVAVRAYRSDASWSHLWKLFPWAAAGIVIGYFALGRVDDTQMRRLIGAILLLLSIFQYGRSRRPAPPDGEAAPTSRLFAPITGITAGFTTMVANAAGPVMMLYLLAMRLPKIVFVGTAAWYFFLLNLFKTPFSASLGLITLATLSVSLPLGLFGMLGAAIGRPIVERLNQRTFELIALGLTFAASLVMLR
ncbi:MAG TPA: sulfite exporter TauE/SafE family protein [Roseiflexaceae bacterium]|nr:sulfite exporter TauE/SafE family protein [Roseiflexaceae bacterium]HMP43161.1 sulfite exporter TauE/SafE family protein [Roseiflexaceae bacterium]